MTTEERLAALEAQVAALTPKARAIAEAEAELIEAGRQFARVVNQGYYLADDGGSGHKCREMLLASEVGTYEAHFVSAMRIAAKRINLAETS